jgi:hypothetical protein
VCPLAQIRASKPGLTFTESRMWCTTPNRFINGAPTMGPHVIAPTDPEPVPVSPTITRSPL